MKASHPGRSKQTLGNRRDRCIRSSVELQISNGNVCPAFFRLLVGRSSRFSRDVVDSPAQYRIFQLWAFAGPVSDCKRVKLRNKTTGGGKVVVQATFDARLFS